VGHKVVGLVVAVDRQKKMLASIYHVFSWNELCHGERSDPGHLKTNMLRRQIQPDLHT